ncbi:MAG: transposase [Nitrososphaerota archaeon]|nr:transposase [Nitrososphaerota archaeon]
MDITTGTVIATCKYRHRHQEFLNVLKRMDESVPANPDIHLVADNYAIHKHPSVKRWLARHPQCYLHYTPTYASWLNPVEIWSNLIMQQAIRRGDFKSA